MLAKFYSKLESVTNHKLIIEGILLIIVFNVILLFIIPALTRGESVFAFDVRFSYSPKEAKHILNLMNDKTRKIYLLSEIFVDIPYAIIYGIVYSLIIISIFKNLGEKLAKYIFLLPFFISISDILENAFVILMITNYPSWNDTFAITGSFFTSMKWIFALTTFILAVSGLLIKTLKRINIQRKN